MKCARCSASASSGWVSAVAPKKTASGWSANHSSRCASNVFAITRPVEVEAAAPRPSATAVTWAMACAGPLVAAEARAEPAEQRPASCGGVRDRAGTRATAATTSPSKAIGQRGFQARLAEVAPRADDVRVDLDLHVASNVREERSHSGR